MSPLDRLQARIEDLEGRAHYRAGAPIEQTPGPRAADTRATRRKLEARALLLAAELGVDLPPLRRSL